MKEIFISGDKIKFIKSTIDYDSEEAAGIETNTGVKFKTHHEQDWCEAVYADWSSLNDTTFFTTEFQDIQIDFVKDTGFRINGYLVNCYNSQNGYYSSNLVLIINQPGTDEIVIDIAGCVIDV